MKRYVIEYANDVKRMLPKDSDRVRTIDKWMKCYKMGIAGELDIMLCLNEEHRRIRQEELEKFRRENTK